MRIAIDISQLVHEGTGVATYTANLVRSLLEVDKENEYLLFGASLRKLGLLRSFAHSLGAQNSFWPIPPTVLELLWNRQHVLRVETLTGKVDIFHSSDWTQPPTRAKKVAPINDMVVFRFSESSHPAIIAAQKRRMEWVKREADRIVVISEATRKDVIEILGIAEERIVVNYLAAGWEYTDFRIMNYESRIKAIGKIKEKYHLDSDYILTVGTREPRKNLGRLIEAYQQLGLKDTQLVIAGKPGWGNEVESQQQVKSNIRVLDYVAPVDLAALYAGAKVFAYPSLYEGFGVPILEAMTCGCPVVTSNLSSMPEVGGKAAIYIDPLDADDIASKLLKVLRLAAKEREQLIRRGFEQASKFSWAKTARETRKIYESL